MQALQVTGQPYLQMSEVACRRFRSEYRSRRQEPEMKPEAIFWLLAPVSCILCLRFHTSANSTLPSFSRRVISPLSSIYLICETASPTANHFWNGGNPPMSYKTCPSSFLRRWQAFISPPRRISDTSSNLSRWWRFSSIILFLQSVIRPCAGQHQVYIVLINLVQTGQVFLKGVHLTDQTELFGVISLKIWSPDTSIFFSRS